MKFVSKIGLLWLQNVQKLREISSRILENDAPVSCRRMLDNKARKAVGTIPPSGGVEAEQK